ncbi:MAG TPA: AraC family transcriptional regulator [Polyangia bacterium]|jgi:AraC-like DNA-binding protein
MTLVGAIDDASFVSAPAGRWRRAGCSIVWAHSPTLTGCISWGRPTPDDTRSVLRLFEGFTRLAPRFDVILDGSSLDKIEARSLLLFADWMRKNLEPLRHRVRRHVGVNAPGVSAFMLAGVLPLIGGGWPLTRVQERRRAFRLVLPEGGDELCDELEALMDQVRGLSPLVSQVRDLLARRQGRLSVLEAARALGRSVRSLQRELRESGYSYRQEQQAVQFRRAEELLEEEDKIAVVAARLGISERTLIALVRAHSGVTPAELRRRLRSG